MGDERVKELKVKIEELEFEMQVHKDFYHLCIEQTKAKLLDLSSKLKDLKENE